MAYEFASRLETFPNYRKFETTFAGRPFVVETGKMCGLSNGSAMIRYGETCVLCNVTMSDKPRDGVDFFPLRVEFEENAQRCLRDHDRHEPGPRLLCRNFRHERCVPGHRHV